MAWKNGGRDYGYKPSEGFAYPPEAKMILAVHASRCAPCAQTIADASSVLSHGVCKGCGHVILKDVLAEACGFCAAPGCRVKAARF